MKWKSAKYALLLMAFGLTVNTVDAQTNRQKTARPATKKPAAKKAATQKTQANVADANLGVAKQDTLIVTQKRDPLKMDTIRKSLRNDHAIEKNLVKERTPLAYEHIREDDAIYREKVWREIDIREKVNQPFRYSADEDNGNQRFIAILLNVIKSGEVVAFDASIDDRFTTPMTLDQIGSKLAGGCDTILVPDLDKDPDLSKGILKTDVVCEEFNMDAITKFRIKEEWVFDKESSRMFVRILGIAPIKTYFNKVTGEVIGESPIFYVYYPDMRPSLARYEVYNGKNFGARMSWEELFESRFFGSYIVKSTLDNPHDQYLKQYIKDGVLRLLEGENVKNKIFNYEQDLWEY
ncbi:MAG: gliding motility protein GldN [Chitinophagaceae bacterium]|nr:gliding motility protein GldN [Chitinophagaceae bacterium]MCW5925989.1 gliding motility protein GldN [Chitinophagaceae bacterium]